MSSPSPPASPMPVANPAQSGMRPVFRFMTIEFDLEKGFGEQIGRFMDCPV